MPRQAEDLAFKKMLSALYLELFHAFTLMRRPRTRWHWFYINKSLMNFDRQMSVLQETLVSLKEIARLSVDRQSLNPVVMEELEKVRSNLKELYAPKRSMKHSSLHFLKFWQSSRYARMFKRVRELSKDWLFHWYHLRDMPLHCAPNADNVNEMCRQVYQHLKHMSHAPVGFWGWVKLEWFHFQNPELMTFSQCFNAIQKLSQDKIVTYYTSDEATIRHQAHEKLFHLSELLHNYAKTVKHPKRPKNEALSEVYFILESYYASATAMIHALQDESLPLAQEGHEDYMNSQKFWDPEYSQSSYEKLKAMAAKTQKKAESKSSRGFRAPKSFCSAFKAWCQRHFQPKKHQEKLAKTSALILDSQV